MGGDHLTLANDSVTYNSAPAAAGGGVYNDEGDGAVGPVGQNVISWNTGGNCAPSGSVYGCTG